MKDDSTQTMFDVLLQGLKLRDRVAAGDRPNLSSEQAKLKGLLGSSDQAPPWGTGAGVDPMKSLGTGSFEGNSDFLGIRYALVCWLDEIMIDAGWREWDENKLELSLYRSNVRYGNFWQQARLAESSPTATGAPFAFFLCVLLGFRGELGETPEKLREWVSATRNRVTRSMAKEPAALPEKTPISDVPELTGADKYRRMTRRLVLGILCAVPLIAFLLVVLLR